MDTQHHATIATITGQALRHRRAPLTGAGLSMLLAGLMLATAAGAQQVSAPEAVTPATQRPLDLTLRSAASAPIGPRSTDTGAPGPDRPAAPYGSGYESRRLAGPVDGSASAAAADKGKARSAPSIWTNRAGGVPGRGGGGGGGGRGRR